MYRKPICVSTKHRWNYVNGTRTPRATKLDSEIESRGWSFSTLQIRRIGKWIRNLMWVPIRTRNISLVLTANIDAMAVILTKQIVSLIFVIIARTGEGTHVVSIPVPTKNRTRKRTTPRLLNLRTQKGEWWFDSFLWRELNTPGHLAGLFWKGERIRRQHYPYQSQLRSRTRCRWLSGKQNQWLIEDIRALNGHTSNFSDKFEKLSDTRSLKDRLLAHRIQSQDGGTTDRQTNHAAA